MGHAWFVKCARVLVVTGSSLVDVSEWWFRLVRYGAVNRLNLGDMVAV